MKIKQAFSQWVLSLDMERLAWHESELLHMLRTVAQWELCRNYMEAKNG